MLLMTRTASHLSKDHEDKILELAKRSANPDGDLDQIQKDRVGRVKDQFADRVSHYGITTTFDALCRALEASAIAHPQVLERFDTRELMKAVQDLGLIKSNERTETTAWCRSLTMLKVLRNNLVHGVGHIDPSLRSTVKDLMDEEPGNLSLYLARNLDITLIFGIRGDILTSLDFDEVQIPTSERAFLSSELIPKEVVESIITTITALGVGLMIRHHRLEVERAYNSMA